MKAVLDASALLAFLHGEPGGDRVEASVRDSAISAVNWVEVLDHAKLDSPRMAGLRSALEALGLNIVPLDATGAEAAAAILRTERRSGLSLGDRACLALAQALGAPVLTADRAWKRLTLDIEVRLIRG